MRLRSTLLEVALLLAFGAGCGSATEGAACKSPERFDCRDSETALECQNGIWKAVACKGQGGCAVSGGQVQCDLSGNAAGDACPFVHEGKGQCSADGRATIECRSGAFVQTNTCASCAVSRGTVECR